MNPFNEVQQIIHEWSLPDMSENVIHQLFYELGVNLDSSPETWKECFMIGLQFLAALWFIWWFVKCMYTLLKSFLRSGM